MQICSLEWAAGLFEGEGCIFLRQRTDGYIEKRLSLTMTDHDVVSRFAEIVCLPECISLVTTNQRKKDGTKKLPAWTWRTGRKADIIRILSMFLPYFGNRRAYKALNVLDHLELAIPVR